MESFSATTNWHYYLLPGLVAVMVLLSWYNMRRGSLLIAICNRWLRWITFSVLIAWVAFAVNWFEKPFWVLFSAAFLGWFLIETVYLWLAINALSKSGIPLFPSFEENPQGEEWPAQKRFLAIRKWLKENGFKSLSSLKAELVPSIQLRMHIFQSGDDKTHIQILFVPQRAGAISMCFTILSRTVEGSRYVTDNMFLPFGGFYPENWYLDRKPLMQGLVRMHRYHRKRIENTKEVFVPWEEDPVDDVNEQQAVLERVNTEMGFLNPINLREEYGKITWEGRYRVWKENWMLNYFGKAYSY